MKKTSFILVSIAFMTLCIISCNKSESSDLHLLELKGNVKSVTYYTTSNVNSNGKKTRNSYRHKGATFNLDEKGRITSGNEMDEELIFTRKRGKIVTMSLPYDIIDENGNSIGFNDAGYDIEYTWDKGYPIKKSVSGIGGCTKIEILYNESHEVIGEAREIYYEGEEESEYERVNYNILETDEHGNWIKRLCMTNGYNTTYSIEERVITYYEDTQNDTSDSWIYGTWKCRTPYGTIEVILREDGRMYNSIEEGWHNYTIEGNRIIEQCDGFISTYNIDRANKRFDCGEPDVWFYKE